MGAERGHYLGDLLDTSSVIADTLETFWSTSAIVKAGSVPRSSFSKLANLRTTAGRVGQGGVDAGNILHSVIPFSPSDL